MPPTYHQIGTFSTKVKYMTFIDLWYHHSEYCPLLEIFSWYPRSGIWEMAVQFCGEVPFSNLKISIWSISRGAHWHGSYAVDSWRRFRTHCNEINLNSHLLVVFTPDLFNCSTICRWVRPLFKRPAIIPRKLSAYAAAFIIRFRLSVLSLDYQAWSPLPYIIKRVQT